MAFPQPTDVAAPMPMTSYESHSFLIPVPAEQCVQDPTQASIAVVARAWVDQARSDTVLRVHSRLTLAFYGFLKL